MDTPSYISALVMLAVAFAAAAVVVVAGVVLGPHRPNPRKTSPWDGSSPARLPFRFQTAAILYIILTVAVVFLLPWAVLFPGYLATSPDMAAFAAGEALVFLVLVAAGVLFAWKRGALQ